MKKDILFYSNFCTYSKELINSISKTPLNESMLFVCVDDDNIQLPPFITAVPTIYLINDKQIVVDEAISEWIKEKLSSAAGPTINNDDIQAYYGACGDSFGQNCSFVDNSESKPFVSSYTFISDDTGNTMAAENSKNNMQSNSDLEKLQKMRNQEFQPISRK
tara:strand:+ start:2578 stop:3063 length:486 start_codon:yes stop_codon:yes gene_type:complete